MCSKSGYIEMCVDESENESCRSEKWINRGKQHMVCVNTENWWEQLEFYSC